MPPPSGDSCNCLSRLPRTLSWIRPLRNRKNAPPTEGAHDMAFRDSFLRAPRRSDAPQKDRGKGQKHGGKMRPRTPERPASPPQECARSAMRVCGRLARSNGSITGLRAAVLQRAARRQRGVARGRRARAGRRYVAADSFRTCMRDCYHSHALLKGVNLCIFVLYTLLLCQPLVSPFEKYAKSKYSKIWRNICCAGA